MRYYCSVTKQEYSQLKEIITSSTWDLRNRLLSYMESVEITDTPKGQRTSQQNRALHTYFQRVSDTLNDAGLDIRAVLKDTVEIPFTAETVKEYLWRPIQKLAVQKESTRELTKQEVTYVWEIFNRHIAKHGVHVPFPSIEDVRFTAIDNLHKENYPEYVAPTI